MKFSVVTPCYNAIRHLPDCVASVRYACAGLDFEHVIADGGSTDGTVDFLQSQPDLSWVSEPDGSMYEALNKAIARASGEVIGHLNTDEQYNKKGLRQALSLLTDASLDGVLGPTVLLDPDGEFIQLTKQVVVPRIIDTHWAMPIQSCSFLYRKRCWERIAYDTSYRLVADHVWFRAQMEAGLSLDVVREPIGIFTWHPDNLSSTEGQQTPENAVPDINKGSGKIKLAKHVYRLRKWLAGGYTPSPVDYEAFCQGEKKTCHIRRPALKVRWKLEDLSTRR